MNAQVREVDWNRMFVLDAISKAEGHVHHECTSACQLAKEVKCVCACGGINRKAVIKRNVKRLDEYGREEEV